MRSSETQHVIFLPVVLFFKQKWSETKPLFYVNKRLGKIKFIAKQLHQVSLWLQPSSFFAVMTLQSDNIERTTILKIEVEIPESLPQEKQKHVWECTVHMLCIISLYMSSGPFFVK